MKKLFFYVFFGTTGLYLVLFFIIGSLGHFSGYLPQKDMMEYFFNFLMFWNNPMFWACLLSSSVGFVAVDDEY